MARSDYPPKTPSSYITPLEAGEKFNFVAARVIFPYTADAPYGTYYYQKVELNGKEVFENEFISLPSGTINQSIGYVTNLESGVYIVTYELYDYAGGSKRDKFNAVTYTFQVVENHYPIRPMTVKEVIERLLELIEPLCVKKNADGTVTKIREQRFVFGYKYEDANSDEGRAERALFEQTCPEMTFTRQTLREQLQQIGHFIHAEPRLIWRTINGVRKMVWIFDRYGGQEEAKYVRNVDGAVLGFPTYPYKAKRNSYDIGVACTDVESDADNFVNRLQEIGGTITEPYGGGALTLRSDTVYTRLEDSENLYFPTTKPIMDITRFEWVDLQGYAGIVKKVYDITPYIFEKTIYDAELSSYSAQYPRSKCYGLYFTQGERNIRGFFFKNGEWSGGVYAKYAIVNILEQVTGKSLKSLLEKNYPKLAFRLTYTPIYGARLSHGKSYTGDMLKKPFSLAYNQSANVVETQYYGEHVKGVAERLGNAEKQVDILMRKVGNIPQIGQLWDDDYYISKVKGSVVSDLMIFNVTLSKRFNRLSEYVGANSYIRYYEVSERMSQERRTLYKDYLVITPLDGGLSYGEDCFAGQAVLGAVANTFYQADEGYLGNNQYPLFTQIVDSVEAQGFSKTLSPQTKVLLPVLSSAFGNAILFSWNYKDNYSAGVAVTYQTATVDKKDITGYFGTEVTYGDYYGRVYYEQYTLESRKGGLTQTQSRELPQDFAGSGITKYAGTGTDVYRILRKDNREIMSHGYEIEFVTTVKGMIIGSALSRNNPAVKGVNYLSRAKLYILPNRVNRFENKVDLTGATEVLEYEYVEFFNNRKIVAATNTNGALTLRFKGFTAPVAGKAWAIVSTPYEGDEITYEGEDGTPVTVTPEYGGELLIAQNMDITAGTDTVGSFDITPAHDIFDYVKGGQQ